MTIEIDKMLDHITHTYYSKYFSLTSDILCAGTNLGSVAMWKYEEGKPGEDEYMRDPEKDWKLQNPTVISGTVKQVS